MHVSLSKTSIITLFALKALHPSSGRVSARGAAAGSAAACSGPRHLHRELPRAAAERRAARRPGQLPGPVQGPGAGPAQLQPTRPAAARWQLTNHSLNSYFTVTNPQTRSTPFQTPRWPPRLLRTPLSTPRNLRHTTPCMTARIIRPPTAATQIPESFQCENTLWSHSLIIFVGLILITINSKECFKFLLSVAALLQISKSTPFIAYFILTPGLPIRDGQYIAHQVCV